MYSVLPLTASERLERSVHVGVLGRLHGCYTDHVLGSRDRAEPLPAPNISSSAMTRPMASGAPRRGSATSRNTSSPTDSFRRTSATTAAPPPRASRTAQARRPYDPSTTYEYSAAAEPSGVTWASVLLDDRRLAWRRTERSGLAVVPSPS